MLQLSKRLQAVAAMVPDGKTIVDIGTDHAQLLISLVQQQKITRAIGIELTDGPFANACRQLVRHNCRDRVEIRQGDGLQPLRPGEAELAVISGLGGNAIVRILEESPEVAATLRHMIIQPMGQVGEVRAWLGRQGWRIEKEELIREGGHFYVIISAIPTGTAISLTDLELEIGPKLLSTRHPLLGSYIWGMLQQQRAILQQLANSRLFSCADKARAIQNRIVRWEAVLKEIAEEAANAE